MSNIITYAPVQFLFTKGSSEESIKSLEIAIRNKINCSFPGKLNTILFFHRKFTLPRKHKSTI